MRRICNIDHRSSQSHREAAEIWFIGDEHAGSGNRGDELERARLGEFDRALRETRSKRVVELFVRWLVRDDYPRVEVTGQPVRYVAE
jgi:hypothetical protein